ncbi:MAG: radical SAM protein [Ignavibacteriales bacterium]|nr:radical SAM protein [Ignavibacteriales bacterium]
MNVKLHLISSIQDITGDNVQCGLNKLKEIQKQYPGNIQIMYGIVFALIRIGKIELAQKEIDDYLKVYPNASIIKLTNSSNLKNILKLLEEEMISLIKSFSFNKPRIINFQANNICNSKCLMCNIWQQKRDYEISIDGLRKTFLNPFFSEVEHVGITGGEPTLRNDLFDLYRILPETLKKLKGASFITNGFLSDKAIEVYSKVNNYYFKMGFDFGGMVSLDGIENVHNKIRGKEKAFEKATKTLFGLRKQNVQVIASCTIIKENVYHLHELLDWGKSNNIYVRFRVAEFINRLYNKNLKEQIRNFNDHEIKHLVSFFHLLISEYEPEEQIRFTYNSILSILSGGQRIIQCPYQFSNAINLDSEGNFAYCAPKGKAHKSDNDIGKKAEANLEERLQIRLEHCNNCVHDYHSEYTPSVNFLNSSKNFYDNLMLYNKLQPAIDEALPTIEFDLKSVKKILLVGWYGTETAGDIAILKGIIQEYLKVNPHLEFVLFSLFPSYSKMNFSNLDETIGKSFKILDYHGQSAHFATIECDAIVMAGGPLMDIPQTGMIADLFRLFYEQHKPRIVEGCGIGPLNVEEYRNNVVQIVKTASKVSVRDSASKALLRNLGIKKEIIVRTDPSITFIKSLKIEYQKQGNIIRCFFRELTHEYPQNISPDLAFHNIICFINKLLSWYPEHKIELWAMHYFPIGKDDREFAKRIVNVTNDERVTYIIQPQSPEEILIAMASADFCIAMRFHSVVFASTVGCNFVAIDYTAGGKIKGFLEDTNQTAKIIALNELSFVNKTVFERMLENKKLPDILENQTDGDFKKLNIVHLSSLDNGGAGKAAYRLNKGLQARGFNSTLLVLNKSLIDESIKTIDVPKTFALQEAWSTQWDICQAEVKKYSDRPKGLEIFTDINSGIKLHDNYDIQNADLINLHWTSGLLDSVYMRLAFYNKPIVWTLHDMNAFTGGCHYSGDCDKYKTGCGACPQLGSNNENDLSRQIWLKKFKAYRNLNLTIVTPSNWLADCASQSPLFIKFPIAVIPNGFPLDVYIPHPTVEYEKTLEFLSPKKLILFGADYETNRKGFNYLIDALEIFSKQFKDINIILGVFGYYSNNFKIPEKCSLINFGKITDENKLAGIYNLADVFVLPSIEDNLPNVIIEALACGLPVVGFNIGGVKDEIEHKKNGYLAQAKNVEDLAEGIRWVLFEGNQNELKINSRAKAEKEYSMEKQALRYNELYQNIIRDFTNNAIPEKAIVNNLFTMAEELIQEGKNLEAKEVLNFILKKEPDNINILNDLVVASILLNDLLEAEKLLHQILVLDPENEVAIGNKKYLEVQHINSRIDDPNVQQQNGNVDSNDQLKNQLTKQIIHKAEKDIQAENLQSARQVLSSLLVRDPDNVDALNDLAVVEILEGNYTRAVEILKQILIQEENNEAAIENIVYLISNKLSFDFIGYKGFYNDEGKFRWIDKEAEMIIPAYLIKYPLEVNFNLNCIKGNAYPNFPFEAQVLLNDKLINKLIFDSDNKIQCIKISLPQSNSDYIIKIISSGHFMPSLVGQEDTRRLAVMFSSLSIGYNNSDLNLNKDDLTENSFDKINKKGKMLLIGMPWWSVEQPYYALAYVGGVVKKAGWECLIEDLNVKIYREAKEEDNRNWESGAIWKNEKAVTELYEKYREYIEGYLFNLVVDNNLDLIGFTINPWTNFFVLKAAEFIKSIKPEIPILFGGLDCFPAYTNVKFFQNNNAIPDIICQGECEVALPKFLLEFEVTRDFRTKIKGFAYRSEKEIINNGEPELPDLFNSDIIADYSQFDFSLYTGLGGFPSFLTRGCINRCNFCSESPNFKKFRFRNPAVVIKEIREGIKYASRVNNVYHIMFAESIHNGRSKIFEEFVDLLLNLKKEHSIIWTSIMALREELTEELIEKMYKAGCWRIFWGFESGSQRVVDLMKKNFKLENAKRIIQTCHKNGIQNLLPLIIGFPGETTEDFISSIDFVLKYRVYGTFLDPDNMYVFPNSKLYTNYKDFDLANNHMTEWYTEDNKNNPSTRLFRTFIMRSLLHNTRYWNLDSIKHLDFNDFSLASEIAAILFGIAKNQNMEELAKEFLENWKAQEQSQFSIEEVNSWYPNNISNKIDLQNWFRADKNSLYQRQRIISFIMDLIFRKELKQVVQLSGLDGIAKLNRTTRYEIEMINNNPIVNQNGNVKQINIFGEELFFEGWALDDLNDDLAGGILIKINDMLFPTNYGFRKQLVLNKLGDRFTNSGFARRIFTSEIGKGKHQISLIVLTKDRKGYFEANNVIEILINEQIKSKKIGSEIFS